MAGWFAGPLDPSLGSNRMTSGIRREFLEFFKLAPRMPVRTTVRPFPLGEANEALARLRAGKIEGAAVLMP